MMKFHIHISTFCVFFKLHKMKKKQTDATYNFIVCQNQGIDKILDAKLYMLTKVYSIPSSATSIPSNFHKHLYSFQRKPKL